MEFYSISDTVRAIHPDNAVSEVRILGQRNRKNQVASGYFSSPDAVQAAVTPYDGQVSGIYITLNEVSPDLLARSENRIRPSAEVTTADQDVRRRKRLLIDFDPVRPTGISSTDAEHNDALSAMRTTRDSLRSLGWPDPIEADSGNGAHLIYGLDLPNTPESTSVVGSVLTALAMQFDTCVVAIDTSVANPARITKLYGTMVCKGDSTKDRPHRRSGIIAMPVSIQPVPLPLLQQLAAQAPDHHLSGERTSSTGGFDIGTALQERGLLYEESEWKGGKLYQLDECPFNPEHRRTARLIQMPNGAWHFGCFHAGCADNHWPEFKLKTGIVVSRSEERGQYKRAFALIAADDLYSLPRPEYLIEDMLTQGAFAAFVAGPGQYKTFAALDWGCHIATGRAWHGKTVRRGPVIYISAEGQLGMWSRIEAWKQHHGVSQLPDFFILPEAVNLMQQLDRESFQEAIASLSAPPVLVVVDTLARNMVGGEENSAKDMGLVINAANTIQRDTGASVLLLHHINKGAKEIRGSTALLGALDTMYELQRDKQFVTLTCKKMKDGPEPDQMVLQTAEIQTSDGLSSLVLLPASAQNASLTPSERRVLQILFNTRGNESIRESEWKKACEEGGIVMSTFHHSRRQLVGEGYVKQESPGKPYQITEQGRNVLGASGSAKEVQLPNSTERPPMSGQGATECKEQPSTAKPIATRKTDKSVQGAKQVQNGTITPSVKGASAKVQTPLGVAPALHSLTPNDKNANALYQLREWAHAASANKRLPVISAKVRTWGEDARVPYEPGESVARYAERILAHEARFPLAEAYVDWWDTGLTVVPICPYCGRTHYHGEGGFFDECFGARGTHCVHGPGVHKDYILVCSACTTDECLDAEEEQSRVDRIIQQLIGPQHFPWEEWQQRNIVRIPDDAPEEQVEAFAVLLQQCVEMLDVSPPDFSSPWYHKEIAVLKSNLITAGLAEIASKVTPERHPVLTAYTVLGLHPECGAYCEQHPAPRSIHPLTWYEGRNKQWPVPPNADAETVAAHATLFARAYYRHNPPADLEQDQSPDACLAYFQKQHERAVALGMKAPSMSDDPEGSDRYDDEEQRLLKMIGLDDAYDWEHYILGAQDDLQPPYEFEDTCPVRVRPEYWAVRTPPQATAPARCSELFVRKDAAALLDGEGSAHYLQSTADLFGYPLQGDGLDAALNVFGLPRAALLPLEPPREDGKTYEEWRALGFLPLTLVETVGAMAG